MLRSCSPLLPSAYYGRRGGSREPASGVEAPGGERAGKLGVEAPSERRIAEAGKGVLAVAPALRRYLRSARHDLPDVGDDIRRVSVRAEPAVAAEGQHLGPVGRDDAGAG